MSTEAMLPCLICNATLDNAFPGTVNQPSDGTIFTSYGQYGSTFWDSFDGEQIVINVCDDCLRERTELIARHKRYRRLTVQGFDVGREWLDREMVPYFDGPEDIDPLEIDPWQIENLPGARVEWARKDHLDNVRECLALAPVSEGASDGE